MPLSNAGSVHAAYHEEPRRPPGSEKGQLTVEPRPAAKHPSLGVELAGQSPQGAEGTPLWPSHALAAPWPMQAGRGAGRRRPGAPCPIWGAFARRHGRSRPDAIDATHRLAARSSISIKRAAEWVLLDFCTPSSRGFARERRRRRGGGMTDRSGVVLFFFYDKT